ncbi:hypothetical protein HMPREF9296_2618 [Prevotella disiens FB035-09AN]|uniref:Uncharacterized protein n=1 Tax=Prevotella disiens FB035-09AN TaxID=866771 RepID=E1KP80_9BACT|nr:hypothetical protein HMPREF9296_2618 [Prevotella disiens FB035-09AN]
MIFKWIGRLNNLTHIPIIVGIRNVINHALTAYALARG